MAALGRRSSPEGKKNVLWQKGSVEQVDFTITVKTSYMMHTHLNCIYDKKAVLPQRWPRDRRYISGPNEPLRRYNHLKLSKMASGRQLGFDVTGNSAIRSADPENPTLEPNMKCIRAPVAQIRPFAYLGHMEPHFGGRGGLRGSAMAPFERAMVVSYRLSIVTVALSVTIRPQFAIECLRRSNQQGVGQFRPKFPGVPLGGILFGSAGSEHPGLTNGEIIFEEFQPMWSQSTNVTDGRTDDMRSQDRALH